MPDRCTHDGWRDYTLLLFLYNCGARAAEAAGMRWDDWQLVVPRQVRLRGKGKKERLLPLWPETANALHRLRGMTHSDEHPCVFINRQGQARRLLQAHHDRGARAETSARSQARCL